MFDVCKASPQATIHKAVDEFIAYRLRGREAMTREDSFSGEGFDSDHLPEFGGELVKLHEYGAGSCFGCGGTVSTYKKSGSGRILNLCMTCGEVVQSPRMVNGKLQDGFEPGTAPPPLRDEDMRF